MLWRSGWGTEENQHCDTLDSWTEHLMLISDLSLVPWLKCLWNETVTTSPQSRSLHTTTAAVLLLKAEWLSLFHVPSWKTSGVPEQRPSPSTSLTSVTPDHSEIIRTLLLYWVIVFTLYICIRDSCCSQPMRTLHMGRKLMIVESVMLKQELLVHSDLKLITIKGNKPLTRAAENDVTIDKSWVGDEDTLWQSWLGAATENCASRNVCVVC